LHIDLLGPLPPPYGGVSVHVERLVGRLRSAGHDARPIAPQGRNEKLWTAYRRIARESNGDVLHAHVAGLAHLVALGALAATGRRAVLTVHGQSLEDELHRVGPFGRQALRLALGRLAGLIAVNDRIADVAVREGGMAPERVARIPAFLPPDREALRAAAPDAAVCRFLADHEPVVAANAFNLALHEGVPLYGADLLPAIVAALRRRHPRAGALLYLATCEGDDAGRLAAVGAAAEAAGVARDLLVVTGSQPFGPALARADVLLRPTTTDGDAVSVREALWLGVPVVASDCVARPAGTILVSGRDPLAYAAAIETALAAPRPPTGGADPFDEVVAVYERALRR
jgi:glycosyltransferase involved in cell wall biosynthesis